MDNRYDPRHPQHRELMLPEDDSYSVCYRTYQTFQEASKNAADVRRNGSPCIVRPNPDRSNPYALWAIWLKPLETGGR